MRRVLVLALLAAGLPLAAAIRGTVVARRDGTPIANARVAALRPVDESVEDVAPLATASSDAQGAFTLQLDGYGVVVVRITATGFAPLELQTARDEPVGRIGLQTPRAKGQVMAVETFGRRESERRQSDRPVVKISGVVRDAEKHPLSGIVVRPLTQTTSEENAVTGDDGAFVLAVPPGEYGLDATNDVYDIAPAEAHAKEGDVRVDLIAQRRPFVDGLVRDAAGQGVAAASIAIASGDRDFERHVGTDLVSDSEGRFRVRLPQFEDGTWIVAAKPGRPPGKSKPLDSRTRSVVITLPEGVSVSGRVTGPGRQPLAGVRVVTIVGRQIQFGPEPDAALEPWAITDADGRFHGLLAEGSGRLSFAKKGYVSVARMVQVTRGVRPVEIVLAATVHIAGRVVTRNGTPRDRVPVAVGQTEILTSDDGTFRVDDLVPAEYWVYFGPKRENRLDVTAPADHVKLVLPDLRSVYGRVVDGKSGGPIEKFTVGEVSTDGLEEPVDSPSGEFRIEVRDTTDSLSITAPGYLLKKVKLESASTPLVIQLSRGRTVRGHVRDEQGQPLGNVDIDEESHTAADGSFEMPGLPPDRDANFVFRKEGFLPARRHVDAGGDATLDVVMSRGASVRGQVVDAHGAGVADVMVQARSAGTEMSEESAKSDESGRFHFDALAPARWDFRVQRERPAQRGAVRDVDVENVHELTIRLEEMPTATIVGHVTGLDPSWPTRFVGATNLENVSSAGEINAEGDYRIENAPAGTVRVEALAGEGLKETHRTRAVEADVAPGSEVRVDLAFSAPLTVHGRVTRGGAPLEGVKVRFRSYEQVAATTDVNGAYTLSLRPGEYDVLLTLDGPPLPSGQQHVVIDEAVELNFTVDVSRIAVMVIDEAGQPLSGVHVTAVPRGRTNTIAEATSGSDGAAILEVPGGMVTVNAALRGFANAAQDVDDGSPVTLRLVRTSGAAVRIVDVRDGRTLAGHVVARDASGRVLVLSNETESDGRMLLSVAPGAYRFSASAEGYGSRTIQAMVPSGEVRITLPRSGALALRASSDLHATARLIQPDGEEYVRCWCNGVAEIALAGHSTVVDRIAPGSYTLEVTPFGGKPHRSRNGGRGSDHDSDRGVRRRAGRGERRAGASRPPARRPPLARSPMNHPLSSADGP